MQWLNQNFTDLKDKVHASPLSDAGKYQFNSVLLKIYAAIEAYEKLEEGNIIYKQVILDAMKTVNDTLLDRCDRYYSRVYRQKIHKQ